MISNLLLYCRAGFEIECSKEISDSVKRFRPAEVISATLGSGYVICRFHNEKSAHDCIKSLPFSSLAFSRQMIVASDEIGPLTAGNRVDPLVDAIKQARLCGSDIFIDIRGRARKATVVETPFYKKPR